MNKIGRVVFPGDTFTPREATGKQGKTRIGIGLAPTHIKLKQTKITIDANEIKSEHKSEERLKEGILVTRAGVVKSRYDNPPKLWVVNRQRRYIPYPEDRVIGIITHRTGLYYEIEIKGPRKGLLGRLEFEGATKRNKPELNVGDIVFCRVSISNRDMQPILSCKSPSFNKSWVSGEALFMQLKGGFIFDCSLNWAQRLNRINSPHLTFLGTFFPFEVAIGINGRIWCKAATVKQTLLLSNILKNGQYLKMQQFQVMVHSMLKKYT